MLQSVLGSKTLSGHNDRNLRLRMWVRSAVFDPRMLCSILKVRFFWETLYNNLICLHLSLRRNPVVRRSIFTTRVLGDEAMIQH